MKNYSKQREIILNVIKNSYKHPTSEEIYKDVNKIDDKISKSTVYRNINLLVEKDVIIKLSMLNGPDRFDYIWKSHSHAVCSECGKVTDFDYEFKKEKIVKAIFSQTGIEANLDSIIIYGICQDCKSKK